MDNKYLLLQGYCSYERHLELVDEVNKYIELGYVYVVLNGPFVANGYLYQAMILKEKDNA